MPWPKTIQRSPITHSPATAPHHPRITRPAPATVDAKRSSEPTENQHSLLDTGQKASGIADAPQLRHRRPSTLVPAPGGRPHTSLPDRTRRTGGRRSSCSIGSNARQQSTASEPARETRKHAQRPADSTGSRASLVKASLAKASPSGSQAKNARAHARTHAETNRSRAQLGRPVGSRASRSPAGPDRRPLRRRARRDGLQGASCIGRLEDRARPAARGF